MIYVTTKIVIPCVAFGWTVSIRRAFGAEKIMYSPLPDFTLLYFLTKINFNLSVRWVELGQLLVGGGIKAMRETALRFST